MVSDEDINDTVQRIVTPIPGYVMYRIVSHLTISGLSSLQVSRIQCQRDYVRYAKKK